MRFGRVNASIICACLFSFTCSAMAQDQGWRQWVQKAATEHSKMEERALDKYGPQLSQDIKDSNSEIKEFQEVSKEILQKTVEGFTKEKGIDLDVFDCQGDDCAENFPDILRLFVSFSLSEQEFIGLFQEASTFEGELYFHLRGLDPITGTIDGTMARLAKLWKKSEIEKRFSVTFAPHLFEQHGIDAVPMMVLERGDGLVITARGFTDFEYFVEQASEASQSGLLAVYGNQVEIAEKHLFEDIKDRMAKMDIREKIAEKGRDYFKDREFETLPYADKDRSWKFDPSIKVTRDMYLPNGKLLHEKGKIINPMATIPYSESIVIADFTNEKQVAFVVDKILPLADTNSVTVMTTRFHEEDGWEKLAEMEDRIGFPIYRLDERIVKTFKFKAVPALAKSKDLHFDVREFGKERWAKEESEQ